jgi:hypothetical protein
LREANLTSSQDEDEHQRTTITTDTSSENPFSATHTSQANLALLGSNCVPTGSSASLPWAPLDTRERSEDFRNLDDNFPADGVPHPEGLDSSTEGTAKVWEELGLWVPPNSFHSLHGSHPVDGAPLGGMFDIGTPDSLHNLGGSYLVDGVPSGGMFDVDTPK